ncbi:neuroendocrine convertase 2-like isoform X2 [Mya arenaria]|uniref:neuroendocrine convertase 2-like isoform X2 n=1 Tax=Mya arenaria TaxID=6604 RepID=UPI0022E8B6A3|nr:neuroendocrine convertase 2-like isoform X2 [Mya arenaria]
MLVMKLIWKYDYFVLSILICNCVRTVEIDSHAIRIVVKSEEIHLNSIKESFETYNFRFDGKISNNLVIFKTNSFGSHRLSSYELEILQHSNSQSYSLYSDIEREEETTESNSENDDLEIDDDGFANVCAPFFDTALGIDKAWAKHGVSGRGVVVGITDVGLNSEEMDITNIVNKELSCDFLTGVPGDFSSINAYLGRKSQAAASVGLIVGKKAGDACIKCGQGVAYGAKVADLQFAKSKGNQRMFPYIDSAIYARALSHRRDAIHILSNRWVLREPFKKSDFYEDDVLTEGLRQGRHGLGSVYVFPAGQPGSGLANHIGSITVTCLGVNGTVADVSSVNAATLVSVFCNGRRKTDTRMVTSGYKNRKCETTHDGELISTAIVSGMIALLLESTPHLTVRDIKHILIRSCSHLGLESTSEFQRNGAGKHYHPKLGFGYPDISAMIDLGMEWQQLRPLCTRTVDISTNSRPIKSTDMYVRESYNNVSCDTNTPCIDEMEEVIIEVDFVYSKQHGMRLWVVSPTGTVSTLAEPDRNQKLGREGIINTRFRSNNFWGEKSQGLWRVYLGCDLSNITPFLYYSCHIAKTRLTIYGTVNTEYAGQYSLINAHVTSSMGNNDSSNQVFFHVTVKKGTVSSDLRYYTGFGVILGVVIVIALCLFFFSLKTGSCPHPSHADTWV